MERVIGTKLELAELSRMVRGSAFIFGCRLAGALITFVTQVLLARWMGAAEFGVYVLAFSWCILLSTVAAAGFPSAAIRFVGGALAQERPGQLAGFVRRSRQVILAISVAISITGLAVIWWGDWLFPAESQMPMTIALMVLPFVAVMHLQSGVANAMTHSGLSFLPSNVARPLLFVVLVSSAWALSPPLAASTAMALQAGAFVVVTLAVAIMLHRRVARVVAAAPAEYETREWTRTALPLVAVALFTGYFPEFNLILVGSVLPASEVAILHVAFRVAVLIAFGLFAVDAFTGPEIARLHARGDQEGLQRIVNRSTRLRFWPALIAVGVLAVAGRHILGLFGSEFTAGYLALVMLALSQLVQAGVGPVTRLLSVSGHQDRCLLVFACALLLAIALVALLVPRFGVNGAAAAALIDVIFWSVWMRYLVIRHMALTPRIL
jgi:O-antigen/teichoic acid export membrane protein